MWASFYPVRPLPISFIPIVNHLMGVIRLIHISNRLFIRTRKYLRDRQNACLVGRREERRCLVDWLTHFSPFPNFGKWDMLITNTSRKKGGSLFNLCMSCGGTPERRGRFHLRLLPARPLILFPLTWMPDDGVYQVYLNVINKHISIGYMVNIISVIGEMWTLRT